MQHKTLSCLLISSLLGMVGLNSLFAVHMRVPFPPVAVSLSSRATRLSDFAGIAAGFRKLTADIAWIQTLIYYGTRESDMTEAMEHNGGGRYPFFLSYCQRVVEIDPYFKHVYYYGAAALGWNLNRLDEAERLLREGIAAHPQEWKLQQFLAALAFQKDHNINSLIDFLKVFIEQKDCPNLLRSILANIYKKQHRYREAMRVWMMVYDTGDPLYTDRSLSQIQEMAPLAQQEARKMGPIAH